MRHPRRDAHDVACRKLSPYTPFDGPVAFFVGAHGLTVDQFASHDQGRRSRFHEKYISLSLVPLDLAVPRAMHEHESVIGKIGQLPHRKMVRVAGSLLDHALKDGF